MLVEILYLRREKKENEGSSTFCINSVLISNLEDLPKKKRYLYISRPSFTRKELITMKDNTTKNVGKLSKRNGWIAFAVFFVPFLLINAITGFSTIFKVYYIFFTALCLALYWLTRERAFLAVVLAAVLASIGVFF